MRPNDYNLEWKKKKKTKIDDCLYIRHKVQTLVKVKEKEEESQSENHKVN